MIKIAPSLISADLACLKSEVEELENWGASLLHYDVMDGHFVPNLSFGTQVLKAIRPYTSIPIDVHLMISQPENYISDFAAAKADIITIHQETTVHLHRSIMMIKEHGVKAGVALNPSTNLSALENVLDIVDLVLLMTVNPGFSGQSFLPSMLQKIAALKKLITDGNYPVAIEVDGGVTIDNAGRLVAAGADILVAGTAIYGSEDRKQAIVDLQTAAIIK